MRRTCGNCQHFGKEPGTPSRGCCWYSAEFDYYAVVGAHEKGCDDWAERTTRYVETRVVLDKLDALSDLVINVKRSGITAEGWLAFASNMRELIEEEAI